MEKINLGQQMIKWNSCSSFEQKTRVFCSMLSTVHSTGGLKKPYYFQVLKILTKQYAKPAREPSLCPETSTKNAAKEFHLWNKRA
jgi:hypothetical protein